MGGSGPASTCLQSSKSESQTKTDERMYHGSPKNSQGDACVLVASPHTRDGAEGDEPHADPKHGDRLRADSDVAAVNAGLAQPGAKHDAAEHHSGGLAQQR